MLCSFINSFYKVHYIMYDLYHVTEKHLSRADTHLMYFPLMI